MRSIEHAMSKYPDAIVYASRAARHDLIQNVLETGVPFRQYDTNFLGHTVPSSIVQSIDSSRPAVFLASASMKTGASDVIGMIRDAASACDMKHVYIHNDCADVGGLLPYSETKSFHISLDDVDSFSCSGESFGYAGSSGIVAGIPVPDITCDRMVDSIIGSDLANVASCTYTLTKRIFDVLFSHRVPSYILWSSNVILVKCPEDIRTAYGFELYDGWTCLRIDRDMEAGMMSNIINDIVYSRLQRT